MAPPQHGHLTQAEAALAYQAEFGLSKQQAEELFFHVTDHQEPIQGTEALARRLKRSGYRVFALTDNVHEIVAYLKARHQFWPLFDDAVVSAEIGLMKPDPAIFRHAIERFGLVAAETVFLDDIDAQRRRRAIRRHGLAAVHNRGARRGRFARAWIDVLTARHDIS
jgi:putative hydrolase of the HAD superfamily